MPTVPYNPVPLASQGQATPSIGVNTPAPPVIGAQFGKAVESLGNAFGHTGDELFNRALQIKTVQNESEAKEADANYIIEVGRLRARYGSTQGNNAVTDFEGFQRDLRETREMIRSGLSNDMSRKMFDRDSLSTMSRAVFSGAGHAATEQRRFAEGASNARVAAVTIDAGNDRSPAAVQRGVQTIDQEVRGPQRAINGWSQEETDVRAAEAKSKLALSHIRGLAPQDPFAAQKFFDENRGMFAGEDVTRAEQLIQTNLYRVGSARIAREIVGGLPEEGEVGESRRELIDRAAARAKELLPGNDDFVAFVRDRVGAEISKRDAVIRNDKQMNKEMIESALMGGRGNGAIPTSPEELIGSSPEAAQAWQRLPASEQRKYMAVMARNARGDVSWTDAGLRRYNALKGMATGAPNEFLNVDLVSENLPWSARRELVNIQNRVRQRPEDNPELTRALTILSPMMRSAGITQQQDRDRYFQFRGALQNALMDFQAREKRPPKGVEEFNKIGSQLLQEQTQPWGPMKAIGGAFDAIGAPGGDWLRGTLQSRTPLFESNPPADLIERFKNDPRHQGRTPSDAEIEQFRLQWVRDQYRKLYMQGGATPQVPQSR